MKTFSVIIRQEIHDHLYSHLIRKDGQEDLCFATYVPSTGKDRSTGILSHVILPMENERIVHGNVGFLSKYLERALSIAAARNEGLIFLHSHPTAGWQGMSADDIVAETRMSPAAIAATGYSLLGLTLGTDGAWSGRFWTKNVSEKRKYDRQWCETVKVIGKGLAITFNDNLSAANFHSRKQLRTISAWGQSKQEDLSRLKIGIVGLGSVGSIVAEILARTGISKFVLIDFDNVEEKNLDRLTNVFDSDIGKSKVSVIAKAIRKSATAPRIDITECEYSICEAEGFMQALDCDVLFSCVDRPWPRQVLNFMAYAHLIPVIDGGILVRTNKKSGKMIGADWRAHTIGYQRTCLECLGQYKTENASLERSGKMDDPSYMAGLDTKDIFDAHENVFCFSSHLASMEVFQLLSMFISPSGINDIGHHMYHFVTGTLDNNSDSGCENNCFFLTIIGKGDTSGIKVYSKHEVAEEARNARLSMLNLSIEEKEEREENEHKSLWAKFCSAIKSVFKKH